MAMPMAACVAVAACTSSGPVIPDNRDRIQPPSAREGTNADDVFMRKPWEIWRVHGGTGRFHREALVLLPDDAESFKVSDVSVYAIDGSDVRLDYASVDLGAGSQSQESISVFVYRASGTLDDEWKSVADRVKRIHTLAKATDPFPLPANYPRETRQMALVAPDRSGDMATFVQVTLFRQGLWTVRYEIACPYGDMAVARDKTRAFLRSLRDLD
jgi:hypothetical protein